MQPCRQHYALVRYQYFTYVTNVFTVNSPFFPTPMLAGVAISRCLAHRLNKLVVYTLYSVQSLMFSC